MPLPHPRALLLDLDGTVYRGYAPIPGATETLCAAQAAGMRTLFITNRSNRPREVVCEQLRQQGIPCEPVDVVTTAESTAQYCGRGKAYVIGENGLLDACRAQGLEVVTPDAETADWVIVSIDRAFTYEKLRAAMHFILDCGARFVATNLDARLPLDGFTLPGSGTLVAAVRTAVGREPELIGKPSPHLFEAALRLLGIRPEEALAVGDNLATDIPAAAAAHIPSCLVLTGISRAEDVPGAAVRPDAVFADWAALAAALGL